MASASSIDKDIYGANKTVKQLALEKIKEAIEPVKNMSDDEKNEYENKLNKKIKTGEKLSQSEMDYIRRTNPIMYLHIKRVQMHREMLEKKLKHCKSKKEVEEVYSLAMSGISKDDPDKHALVSAYDNVTNEFKKTGQYKSLPWEVKKKEKREKEQEKMIEDVVDTVDWSNKEMSLFDVRA